MESTVSFNKKNMKRTFIFLMTLAITSLLYGQNSDLANQYQIVYEADKDGNRISGSLEQLLELVNNGNPVRVGWELVSKWPGSKNADTVTVMKHWTDGGFVTTQRGHVFAQIRGIFGQGFAHIDSPAGIFLSTDQPNSWVAVIGTNGTLISKFKKQDWMEGLTKEQLKEMEKMNVKTMWAVMTK